MALAVSLAYKPSSSPFSDAPPYSDTAVKLLKLYAAVETVAFVAAVFGLIATITQGRRFKRSFPIWIICLCILSIYQVVCLFYVILEFNSRVVSAVGLAIILFFVPKNLYFCITIHKYRRVVELGFYTTDYVELDADNYIRRSRSSSRKESIRTLKDHAPYENVSMDPISSPEVGSRKTTPSSLSFLRMIPEASESKENSLEDRHEL